MPRGRVPDDEGKDAALKALLLTIGLAVLVGAMLLFVYRVFMAMPV